MDKVIPLETIRTVVPKLDLLGLMEMVPVPHIERGTCGNAPQELDSRMKRE